MQQSQAWFAEHRITVSRFIVIFLVAGALWLPHWPQELGYNTQVFFELVGCLLLMIAGFGRMWCALYIADKKTRVLMMQGPYSVTRNPLYLFSYFGGVGFFLAIAHLPSILWFSVIFAGYYRMVILHEESILVQHHGKAFAGYCERVPRFWPKLSLFTTESTATIDWRCFGKSFIDSMWFFGAIFLVLLINA